MPRVATSCGPRSHWFMMERSRTWDRHQGHLIQQISLTRSCSCGVIIQSLFAMLTDPSRNGTLLNCGSIKRSFAIAITRGRIL